MHILFLVLLVNSQAENIASTRFGSVKPSNKVAPVIKNHAAINYCLCMWSKLLIFFHLLLFKLANGKEERVLRLDWLTSRLLSEIFLGVKFSIISLQDLLQRPALCPLIMTLGWCSNRETGAFNDKQRPVQSYPHVFQKKDVKI